MIIFRRVKKTNYKAGSYRIAGRLGSSAYATIQCNWTNLKDVDCRDDIVFIIEKWLLHGFAYSLHRCEVNNTVHFVLKGTRLIS